MENEAYNPDQAPAIAEAGRSMTAGDDALRVRGDIATVRQGAIS
jgi:hypothetical protein